MATAIAPRPAKVAAVTRDPRVVRRRALPVIIETDNVLCALVGELEWAEEANVRGCAAFELGHGTVQSRTAGRVACVCCVRVLGWFFFVSL